MDPGQTRLGKNRPTCSIYIPAPNSLRLAVYAGVTRKYQYIVLFSSQTEKQSQLINRDLDNYIPLTGCIFFQQFISKKVKSIEALSESYLD